MKVSKILAQDFSAEHVFSTMYIYHVHSNILIRLVRSSIWNFSSKLDYIVSCHWNWSKVFGSWTSIDLVFYDQTRKFCFSTAMITIGTRDGVS